MKEKYEALKMEVIAFEGEIFTATAERPDDIIIVSGDGRTPGQNSLTPYGQG